MTDFTDKYNTKLASEEEQAYRKWAKDSAREQDTYDYDMRGAWKANVGQADNGHFPDTYKKPNHPTFSDESIYHGVDGYQGGSWSSVNGTDVFVPGPANLSFRSQSDLQEYLNVADPGVVLGTRPQ